MPAGAMSTVEVREYRREDLDALHALDVECFAEPFRFSRATVRRFAEAGNARTFVAQAHGTILGFCIVHVDEASQQAYVVTLDVAEPARRLGIATQLMACAETHARVTGCRETLLHVHTGNDSAVRFYERAGYERLGVTEYFYGRDAQGCSIDAWLYRRVLLPD